MVLNKQKGNMYPWVTHTWNPIKGRCLYDCSYCYMKRFPQKEIRLVESEFKTDLGKGNIIFVGSSTDMFSTNIPNEWIEKVLNYLTYFNQNRYLLQTKNPVKFYDLLHEYAHKSFSKNIILGTTIETNRVTPQSKAPSTEQRFKWLLKTKAYHKMISIEPIMDFDVNILSDWIMHIKPDFVSIGADSQGYKLLEPNAVKIQDLVSNIQEYTEVRLKDNLKRIVGE